MGYSNSRVSPAWFQKPHADISMNYNFFSVKRQILVIRDTKGHLSDDAILAPHLLFPTEFMSGWTVSSTEFDMM